MSGPHSASNDEPAEQNAAARIDIARARNAYQSSVEAAKSSWATRAFGVVADRGQEYLDVIAAHLGRGAVWERVAGRFEAELRDLATLAEERIRVLQMLGASADALKSADPEDIDKAVGYVGQVRAALKHFTDAPLESATKEHVARAVAMVTKQ